MNWLAIEEHRSKKTPSSLPEMRLEFYPFDFLKWTGTKSRFSSVEEQRFCNSKSSFVFVWSYVLQLAITVFFNFSIASIWSRLAAKSATHIQKRYTIAGLLHR